MKRVAAAALALGALLEFGGCSQSGGSGDLGHPNIEETAPARDANPNQREYRGKGRNERPEPQKSRQSDVVFEVGLTPPRNVSITWNVGANGMTESGRFGQWSIRQPAQSGDLATLLVENHSSGGRTHCIIRVNGKLLVPGYNEDWNSYEHRNDAGDCRASVVVP